VPDPTLSVSVEEPPVVTDVGFSVAVVPAGAPLALRLIVSAEPLTTVVPIVEVPLPPCTTETLLGFALIEKSLLGGGGGAPPHPANRNEPIVVCQLKLPLTARYSVVYQNVQSSLGSILMLE
jgi:hypothetical protein